MASAAVLPRPTPRSPSPDQNSIHNHRLSTISSHRDSQVSSSAASFRTAPLTAASASHNSLISTPPRSSATSLHTLTRDHTPHSENINPIHALAAAGASNGIHSQEVHILKVKGDKVHLEAGPVADASFLTKVGRSLVRTVQTTQDGNEEDGWSSHVGPPPPSPPESVNNDEDSNPPPIPHKPTPTPTPPPTRPIIYDEPEPIRDRQPSTTSTSSREIRFSPPPSTYSHSRTGTLPSIHRASTDTKSSQRTTTTSSSSTTRVPARLDETPTATAPTSPVDPQFPESSSSAPGPSSASDTASGSKSISHLSADGYLQPPPISMHRPTRRNTTGSATRHPHPAPAAAQFASHSQSYADDAGADELASDIQLHAEQIRRERMSKRAKAEAEAVAAAALTRSETKEGGPGAQGHHGQKDDVVLVGNLIGEDHVNYVLMYNMLTGIRIGVSRCQAKIKRALTDEDFTARHKFSFDIVGNELTPSAKYDFKFKDYAPWVFRELREDLFHLDPADYLLSLTSKYILSELGSPGKSGSFFYFSRDYRFIIKTIRHSEHKFLLSILKAYHTHVKTNPHTLLSRFYGLHRVKLPRGRKIHFVIMNNLFPPHRDIHETYDLKGSTVGREYPEEKAQKNPRAVLKDLNWIKRGKQLELGPEKRALLTEQLRRDSEFLKGIRVMDYSLLVGIHNMQRGNRDNVRRNTLKVFSPDIPTMHRKPTSLKGGALSPEAVAMRRAMRESDPKRLGRGKGTIRLPEEDTTGGDSSRQHFLFYQDEGGLRATDEEGNEGGGGGFGVVGASGVAASTSEDGGEGGGGRKGSEGDVIYYLGVIDILTPYGPVKKLEHFWKGLKADRHKISPVQPAEYADRFLAFMKAIMRGGGGGAPFMAE